MNNCQSDLNFFHKVRRYSPSKGTERSVSFFEDLENACDFALLLYQKHFPGQIDGWERNWKLVFAALESYIENYSDNSVNNTISKEQVEQMLETLGVIEYEIRLSNTHHDPSLIQEIVLKQIGSEERDIIFYENLFDDFAFSIKSPEHIQLISDDGILVSFSPTIRFSFEDGFVIKRRVSFTGKQNDKE